MAAPQVFVSMRPSVEAALICSCDFLRSQHTLYCFEFKPLHFTVGPSEYLGSPLQNGSTFDIARSSDIGR